MILIYQDKRCRRSENSRFWFVTQPVWERLLQSADQKRDAVKMDGARKFGRPHIHD